ncbi:acyl-CoA dehydrogenase family protein [Lentzea sp. NBRC 102530]|uniref:acyl-CoA dehydrogenase family protein n=1 Tax=Lentzea sp. NBRC 102530 TaxID=3032201 RepID=UPI0024A4AEF8|nr:acyl-CoA dehydrogenase family protein [Lentzea sp. NBRC 102530]GLY47351.1 acyl-CoA dehydrogenase [Lentzea sp. NBRC 102530]
MLERISAFVRERVWPSETVLDAGGQAAREELARLRGAAKTEGLWALPLPRELGGGGLGLTEYFSVAEQEGSSDHGPAALGSACLLDVRMFQRFGGPAVGELLKPLVAGEISGSYAMTEPGVAGSDPRAVRTTAVRTSDGWVLNGRKWFTSGAGNASYVTVLASGSLFVATDFRVVREIPVLGAAGQFEIALDDVRVPHDHLLGAEGDGLRIAGTRLALGRTLRCLRWLGMAERAFDLMCCRAGERQVRGSALADRQLVRQHVFESALAIRSARALTRQAADLVAAEEDARVEIGLAKVAAARTLHQVCDAAIQVFGAEGLGPDTPLPVLARIGRAARILDGADEMHVSDTARRLLRTRAS